MKENGEKRERCKIKMEIDEKVIKNRDKEIEELQKQYDRMFGIKQLMERMIKKHQIYEVNICFYFNLNYRLNVCFRTIYEVL